MNTGAHPDDEHSGLLAALRYSFGMRVVILCSTRGEGGQNALGPERGGALGVVRTREMEEAARVLDASDRLGRPRAGRQRLRFRLLQERRRHARALGRGNHRRAHGRSLSPLPSGYRRGHLPRRARPARPSPRHDPRRARRLRQGRRSDGLSRADRRRAETLAGRQALPAGMVGGGQFLRRRGAAAGGDGHRRRRPAAMP